MGSFASSSQPRSEAPRALPTADRLAASIVPRRTMPKSGYRLSAAGVPHDDRGGPQRASSSRLVETGEGSTPATLQLVTSLRRIKCERTGCAATLSGKVRPLEGSFQLRALPRLPIRGTPVAAYDMSMDGDRGPIRVLIVDDDPLVRSALRLMLGGRGDLIVIGEAGDGGEALEAVLAASPDVVLMDVRMPRIDGIEAARRLRELPDSPRLLMLTTFDTDEYVLDALAAGADGFLVKGTPPDDLISAIRTVADGDTILSPQVARTVVDHVRRTRREAPPTGVANRLRALTERELEVVPRSDVVSPTPRSLPNSSCLSRRSRRTSPRSSGSSMRPTASRSPSPSTMPVSSSGGSRASSR